MDAQIERTLPLDIEIEQALLGSMIRHKQNIDAAASEIGAEHFSDPLHARIFETMVHLAGEGDVSPVLLHAVMKHDPGLREVGGMAYLAGLAQAAPSTPNIRDYCRITMEMAQRRTLIGVGEELVDLAYEVSPDMAPARALADKATERLLLVGAAARSPMVSAYDTAMQSAQEVEAMWRGEVMGIPTGSDKLDAEIGSMRPTDFIVIPAKPGMGKSALMASISMRAALAGFPVKVFSLEMTRRQWVDRNVCDLDYDLGNGALWYGNVRNGKLSKDELERYVTASRRLFDIQKNYEIDDEPGLTVQQISSRSRAFKAKHPGKPVLIVVDYIQKIEPSDLRDTRERQVAGIAMGLKHLAKRDELVVLAGSQLNEDDQKRSSENQRPRGSDVRESKVILQECDLMLSPWRALVGIINRKPLGAASDSADWKKWAAEYREHKNSFELLGLKARHGRQFDISLHCDMAASAIRDQRPTNITASTETQAQQDMLEGI